MRNVQGVSGFRPGWSYCHTIFEFGADSGAAPPGGRSVRSHFASVRLLWEMKKIRRRGATCGKAPTCYVPISKNILDPKSRTAHQQKTLVAHLVAQFQ